jgi:hypothetical protein
MFGILIGSLLLLAFGVLTSAFGYKLFKILLPIWGFFAGFALGSGFVTYFLSDGFLATLTSWGVALFVGFIFAILSYVFYYVGIIILGATFGVALTTAIMFAIGFNPGFLVTIIAMFGGLVFAGLAVIFNIQKYLIVLITSILGASTALSGLFVLFGKITLEMIKDGENPVDAILQDSLFWSIVWIIMIVVGLIAQSRTSRGTDIEMQTYTITGMPTYN